MSDMPASRKPSLFGEDGRRTQAGAAGAVALVGAGPGDPDLLTIKAARLIGDADVIFVDRLVGKGIVALANPAAQIVPVGKSKGEHSVPQDEIHARMIAAAREGKRVVRLKGGDPFIFGRGGEEVEALRAAGVAVEIVPGISAALGVAASTQIPLTHRDMAQAVTFVTGHAALGQEPDLDWPALARPNQTVVVYMGVGTAGMIAARLTAAGRDVATPVAVIENGTRENEIRAFGSLGELSDIIQRAGIQGPALLIIGEVVGLARGQGSHSRASEARPGNLSLAETQGHAGMNKDSRVKPENDSVSGGSGVPTLSDLWRMFS